MIRTNHNDQWPSSPYSQSNLSAWEPSWLTMRSLPAASIGFPLVDSNGFGSWNIACNTFCPLCFGTKAPYTCLSCLPKKTFLNISKEILLFLVPRCLAARWDRRLSPSSFISVWLFCFIIIRGWYHVSWYFLELIFSIIVLTTFLNKTFHWIFVGIFGHPLFC